MKNKVKVIALILALIVSMASIVGCSNNSSTSAEASVSRNSSIESSIASSMEEYSTSESSVEVSYETTNIVESSVSSNSNSSAIDPAVEERSYNKDEQTKFQSTRILNYKYYPYNKTYYYKGNESTITIPEVFSECPHIMSDTVKEIIVPETIKKITTDAFTGCPNL